MIMSGEKLSSTEESEELSSVSAASFYVDVDNSNKGKMSDNTPSKKKSLSENTANKKKGSSDKASSKKKTSDTVASKKTLATDLKSEEKRLSNKPAIEDQTSSDQNAVSLYNSMNKPKSSRQTSISNKTLRKRSLSISATDPSHLSLYKFDIKDTTECKNWLKSLENVVEIEAPDFPGIVFSSSESIEFFMILDCDNTLKNESDFERVLKSEELIILDKGVDKFQTGSTQIATDYPMSDTQWILRVHSSVDMSSVATSTVATCSRVCLMCTDKHLTVMLQVIMTAEPLIDPEVDEKELEKKKICFQGVLRTDAELELMTFRRSSNETNSFLMKIELCWSTWPSYYHVHVSDLVEEKPKSHHISPAARNRPDRDTPAVDCCRMVLRAHWMIVAMKNWQVCAGSVLISAPFGIAGMILRLALRCASTVGSSKSLELWLVERSPEESTLFQWPAVIVRLLRGTTCMVYQRCSLEPSKYKRHQDGPDPLGQQLLATCSLWTSMYHLCHVTTEVVAFVKPEIVAESKGKVEEL